MPSNTSSGPSNYPVPKGSEPDLEPRTAAIQTPDCAAVMATTSPATSTARYGAGPSNGRSHAGSSAPGVAQEGLRRQGAPEGEAVASAAQTPAESPSPLRAAAEAAVHRVARRRRRDGTQRTYRVDVRYSHTEQQAIKAKAQAMEIAGAHLVGAVVMAFVEGTQPLPDRRTETDDLIDELVTLRTQVAKIGGNVNQIAHRLNAGGDPYPADIPILAQAQRTLDTVRAAIADIETAAHSTAGRKAA